MGAASQDTQRLRNPPSWPSHTQTIHTIQTAMAPIYVQIWHTHTGPHYTSSSTSSRLNICATLRTVCALSSASFTRRSCVMGPWRSLLTMPFVMRSTVSFSVTLRPPSLLSTLASSFALILSALVCSMVIMGTVPRLCCHDSNATSSSRSTSSASTTSFFLLSWFALTTAFKSSTLYALQSSISFAPSSSMLRGTEMSTSIVGRTIARSRSGPTRIGSVAPVHAKVTWCFSTAPSISVMGAYLRGDWGKLSMISFALSLPLLMRVMERTLRGVRCCTSSLPILPAPMIATSSWSISRPRSATHCLSTSSTAAEEMDTPPLAIPVSERTRLPAVTAVTNILVSSFPAPPFSPVLIS
mmetsp:Transcript_20374/g.49299  ORF Transcript_20374/g.49299 Transcript_20374/m.49299 type:complete len:355 (-) Transcript_20374:623-1687(-)